jgi:hypothetical protein
MAWIVTGAMLPTYSSACDGTHGPLPCKRWIKSPADKRHKVSKRNLTPSRVVKDDASWERTAILYAEWLARRDGVALPGGNERPKAEWSGVYSKTRKGARGQAIYERRICSVAWGHKEPVYNTRKDGRRGAWLYDQFVPVLTITIPHWDWQPEVTEEHDVTDCPSIAPAPAPEAPIAPAPIAPIAPAPIAPEAPIARPAPGTPEWLAAKASGPRWRYDDARGVGHEGFMERFSDHGGTDVTYWMRDGATGELSLVSGSRAKAMNRIWKAA